MVSPTVRSLEGSPMTHQSMRSPRSASTLHHAPRAVDRGSFLVAGDEERDRAAVLRVRAARTPRSRSAWPRARSSCPPRRGRRACRRGPSGTNGSLRHSSSGPVGTTSVCPAKHSSGAARPAPRPEILHAAEGQPLDRETRAAASRSRQQLLAALVGRGDGAAAQQILSQLKSFGHQQGTVIRSWVGRSRRRARRVRCGVIRPGRARRQAWADVMRL